MPPKAAAEPPAQADGESGSSSSSSSTEEEPPAPAADCCGRNFGTVPAHAMALLVNDRFRTCRRCNWPVADHPFDVPPPAAAVLAPAAPQAGAAGADGASAGGFMKQLQKTTDALMAQASFRVVFYAPHGRVVAR